MICSGCGAHTSAASGVCTKCGIALGAPRVGTVLLTPLPVDEAATSWGSPQAPGDEGSAPGNDVHDAELTAEQLKRYLEWLRPEDFGKFNP